MAVALVLVVLVSDGRIFRLSRFALSEDVSNKLVRKGMLGDCERTGDFRIAETFAFVVAGDGLRCSVALFTVLDDACQILHRRWRAGVVWLVSC